ncbi:MAG: TatD family hydrolase [Candidatus Pacebacteria bacterium]|nr:TatD family hydrolase [Candidatus Paceibacterota bacterium]
MKYVDTHAHLNLTAFAEDALIVAKKCAEKGVVVINVGTKASTSKRAVELAMEADNCEAIIGLHPINTVPDSHDEEGGEPEIFDAGFYRELAKSGKVVGIGECGFDYWHTPADSYEIQERAFIAQIELANELNLPLMIHTRGPQPGKESPTRRSVYQDVYEVLKQYAKVPFNIHFYAGTSEEAARFFELGGTISFTGVITFAKAYEKLVKNAPLTHIHAETDCPYVAPVPYRGGRAEPWMVKEVYKKIALIRGEEEEVVRQQLLENAKGQYKLKI